MRFRASSVASVAFACLSCACSSGGDQALVGTAGPAGPGGIVLVSIDTLRADLLSIHGGPVSMPALESLAARGVVFDDTATPSPMTRPAATALLTGLPPDRSGVRDDLRDSLEGGAQTLASLFADRGRTTLGIVGTPFCSRSSGLDAGFGTFEGPEVGLGLPERYAPPGVADAEIAGKFSEWLPTLTHDESFFAWLHLAGLYGSATEHNEAAPSADAYRGKLEETDRALGEIFAALEQAGRFDDTLVVVVGTHGVLLGENGARGSAFWLEAENLRVPLVIKGAAGSSVFEPGSRSLARIWLPDLAATLASVGEVSFTDTPEGIDLTTGLPDPGRVRRAWTWAPDDELGWPTLTAVNDGFGWRTYGFDVLDGAGGSQPTAVDPLQRQAASRPADPRIRELSDEMKRRLEGEGLVRSWQEIAADPPDIAKRNELLARLQVARWDFGRGNLQGGRVRTRRTFRDFPDNLAMISMALYARATGGAAEPAVELAREALERYPQRADLLHWGGHAYQLAGEDADGELLLEAALTVLPSDPELMYDLACARALAGDGDTALDRLEQAVDAGFTNFRHIEQDPELTSIRGDPRYAELMGRRER